MTITKNDNDKMGAKENMEKQLNSYFPSSVEHSVNVTLFGKIAYVNIDYTDYKPKNVVIRELIEMFPNIDLGKVERHLSDKAYMLAMKVLLAEDPAIWIQEGDEMKLVGFGDLLEEQLFDKEVG